MPDSLVIKVAVTVTCSLSVIGASFIIVSFLLSKEFRKSQSRRLLFILSICDLITAVAYLLNSDESSGNITTLCKAQAALNIFGNQASFFWTDFISLFLFLSRKYGVKHASRYIPLFHIISWGWPILSVILVANYETWGTDNGETTAYWCWISSDITSPLMWRLIAGKAVEWTSCVFITIMYIFVFVDLRKKVDQSPATQLLITHRTGNASWKNTEKKLLAIPFIFVILRTSGTIRTVYEAVRHEPLEYTFLVVLQAIGDSGQGFANGLLFGLFTGKVRSFYRKLIASCATSSARASSLNFYGKKSSKEETVEYYATPTVCYNA
jgi:G protein-coupled receptor 157